MSNVFYKTQCEIVKTSGKDFLGFNFNNYFLILGDILTSYNFHDSKEKARLEFYFDLLEKYRYAIGRIEFDVEMPAGYSGRPADIVVFRDSERKIPYIVADCCKDGISDAAFETGVKSAIGKAEALGADFAVCATRLKRRVVKLTHANGVIYAKTVCDLPVLYGLG